MSSQKLDTEQAEGPKDSMPSLCYTTPSPEPKKFQHFMYVWVLKVEVIRSLILIRMFYMYSFVVDGSRSQMYSTGSVKKASIPSCTQCHISALTNWSLLYWVTICGTNTKYLLYLFGVLFNFYNWNILFTFIIELTDVLSVAFHLWI